jgi:hypothetical protein
MSFWALFVLAGLGLILAAIALQRAYTGGDFLFFPGSFCLFLFFYKFSVTNRVNSMRLSRSLFSMKKKHKNIFISQIFSLYWCFLL